MLVKSLCRPANRMIYLVSLVKQQGVLEWPYEQI